MSTLNRTLLYASFSQGTHSTSRSVALLSGSFPEERDRWVDVLSGSFPEERDRWVDVLSGSFPEERDRWEEKKFRFKY
jgi:hypothetical protein